jgi:ribosomal protein L29
MGRWDMSANWDTIYRSYSDEELTEERAKIKKQLDNSYTSQNTGSKSYTRDIQMLERRMTSIATIMNERNAQSGGNSGLSGQVDFGGNSMDDF